MFWILVLFFRKYLLKVLGDVAVLVKPSTGYFTNKRMREVCFHIKYVKFPKKHISFLVHNIVCDYKKLAMAY